MPKERSESRTTSSPLARKILPFQKREHGEREEDEPHGAHQHGHDQVDDVEPADVERVAEHAQRRDPSHCRSVESKSSQPVSQGDGGGGRTVRERQRPAYRTSKKKREKSALLVKLEPVREDAEEEEKDGEAEEEQSRKDARREPDLARQWGYQIVLRKALS
ncbi:hypothetical protein EW146_g9585 [Bondarzewia mesenterica]|uniref:Uncharacterized protein n=1 Tax=Bondarzewia mesenterica TaxID=1095465 RepID=A0A4S4L5H7_9AGAM|nr:hypothetical protein EW146_g9585 [Bondarzewia mesenterica]